MCASSTAITGVTVTMMALSFLAIIARSSVTAITKARISISDAAAAVGLLSAWIVSCMIVYEAHHGLVESSEGAGRSALHEVKMSAFAVQIAYAISLTATKTSLLLFYLSLLRATRAHRATICVIGLAVLAWGLGLLLVSILSCIPVKGFYDAAVKSTCVDASTLALGAGISHVVLDCAILGLPVGPVLNLSLSRRQQVLVATCFLAGAVFCVVSVLRLAFALRETSTSQACPFGQAAVWTVVEVNLAVLAASLPPTAPLLRYLFPRSLASRSACPCPAIELHDLASQPRTRAADVLSGDWEAAMRRAPLPAGVTTTAVAAGGRALGAIAEEELPGSGILVRTEVCTTSRPAGKEDVRELAGCRVAEGPG